MKNILLLVFTIVSMQLCGQDITDRIKSEAIKFNQFLLEGKYEQYANMMNPSVVYSGGGPKYMAGVEKEKIEALKKGGVKLVSISPLKVGELTQVTGGGFQTILTQEIIMTVGGEMFRQEAYYLAASDPDGKWWNFIDLEPYDKASIKDFIPEFSDDIEIPTRFKPEMIKK